MSISPKMVACLLATVALAATGCGADLSPGGELVSVGIAGGETISAFYDALIQFTVDTVEVEIFVRGLRNRPSEDLREGFETQIASLSYRKQFAHRLTTTYTALGELLRVDASKDVQAEVESLVGSLAKIPQLPVIGAIVPSNVVGPIAGELAAWRQSRDVRRGVQLVVNVLDRFAKLYEREGPAYTSIAQQRANNIGTLVDLVISEPTVVLPRSMKMMIESLELDFSNLPKDQPSGLSSINAFKQLARVRAEQRALATATAGGSIGRALVLSVDINRTYSAGRRPSLVQVRAAWDQAKLDVDRMKRP